MNLNKFHLEELGEFTSKSKLSQLLQISSRTLYQYHEIAMVIGDFENDYPSITKGSKAITKAELTKYQCWVLFSLILVCRRLSRQDVYNCLLQDENPGFTIKFSKDSYHQLNPQEVKNHDITTVCKAA
ncbi:MAG: hypothetical protein ACKPJH_24400 [Dolichospermum sp.]